MEYELFIAISRMTECIYALLMYTTRHFLVCGCVYNWSRWSRTC